MSIGPERARLRQYLQGARHDATDDAGLNWFTSGEFLGNVSQAMIDGAKTVTGDKTGGKGLSGDTARAVLEAFHTSATSMQEKSVKIQAAGEALQATAAVMRKAEEAEAKMDVLEQPAAYSPPTYSPGYQPTPAEISAEGDKRSAANSKMTAYNTARAEQESAASDWAQKMDDAFIAAIPPMRDIHGEPDPTEPPPKVPGNPTTPHTPSAPGTPGTPTGPGPRDPKDPAPTDPKDPDPDPKDPDPKDPDPKDPDPKDPDPKDPDPKDPDPKDPDPKDPDLRDPDPRDPTLVPHPHPNPGSHPTTTIIGSSQSGITYNAAGGNMSAPIHAGSGPSAGASAAALGAAGGAGGMAAGAIRPGAVPTSTTRGATPVRPIGSTGRAGSAGALSRSAGSAGSAGRAGSAGSPSSRGAGSAGGRGASTGSGGGRGSAKGSAGGRSAGGRGAGSSAGSRSGGRGTGSASGRGSRKGEDEKSTDRDSLVYDQDWLGDDDVAPGVLD